MKIPNNKKLRITNFVVGNTLYVGLGFKTAIKDIDSLSFVSERTRRNLKTLSRIRIIKWTTVYAIRGQRLQRFIENTKCRTCGHPLTIFRKRRVYYWTLFFKGYSNFYSSSNVYYGIWGYLRRESKSKSAGRTKLCKNGKFVGFVGKVLKMYFSQVNR
jgi:hypothetical protein